MQHCPDSKRLTIFNLTRNFQKNVHGIPETNLLRFFRTYVLSLKVHISFQKTCWNMQLYEKNVNILELLEIVMTS